MDDDNSNRDYELEAERAAQFWTDLEPTSDRPSSGSEPTFDQFLYDIKTPNKRGRKIIDYPAKISPTTFDIVFASGFYEGEGHVRLDKSNQISLAIVQNDKEILDRLNLQFGGVVHGPYKNKKGNDYYYWMLVRERAIGFMFTIYTFLSKSRKRQFKSVLSGNPISREYKKYEKRDKKLDKYFRDTIKAKDSWMD